MNNTHSKLALALVTLVVLLVLALGSVAPGMATWIPGIQFGTVDTWDGLHNLLAPHAGGGSSAG